jgi:hypothetical protein
MGESEYEKTVVVHYSQKSVQQEITKFSQNRWVALHCETLNQQGYPVWLRYQKASGASKAPLTIKNDADVPALLERYKRLKPRTFYASICVYKELTSENNVKDFANIVSCSPVWDVDNVPEKWTATIEVAKEIFELLREEGVSRSVFLKWSGQGAHVHVHHKAFSLDLFRRIAPLDVAYAVVEYVNRALKTKLAEIVKKHGATELGLENETDVQRVFTCPLSLHRSLSSVAVCISPESIDEFTPEWTKPGRFRHWQDWDRFDAGEGDTLAKKAHQWVGGYKVRPAPKPKPEKATQPITKWLGTE